MDRRDHRKRPIPATRSLSDHFYRGRFPPGNRLDTDLRLTRYFGLTPGFFLGLQADHDLMERRGELGPALELIAPRRVMEARETSRRRRI